MQGFQSTPPSREATGRAGDARSARWISIHASLAGGDSICSRISAETVISIHASLAGGDRNRLGNLAVEGISIHASLAGVERSAGFQSTPPSREATTGWSVITYAVSISIHASLAGGDSRQGLGCLVIIGDFNPRLPRGRRPPARGKPPLPSNFNPRLPRGRRLSADSRACSPSDFNPRLPRGRRHSLFAAVRFAHHISIHASLAGGDKSLLRRQGRHAGFQSTPPSREATVAQRFARETGLFQSTPPSREATSASAAGFSAPPHFNPRLPRGRRHLADLLADQKPVFQSTPPSREATPIPAHGQAPGKHFNPRLPRGRRPATTSAETAGTAISIHASLAGGDWLGCAATFAAQVISIHASLAGGDLCRAERTSPWDDFNPRLPRGRRHLLGSPVLRSAIFQSTPPSRESTLATADRGRDKFISIHASLAGGDFDLESGNLPRRHFNPRLPRGRRP